MPTVAELERLQALVGRLQSLAGKRRGELIAADDWNALVQAVLEVTRAALASDRQESVAPHAHPDEVGLGWLDARLRQLLTAGGLADPAAKAELGKLRRALDRVGARIDVVDAGVKDVRFRVADVSTKDLAREADLTRVARRVDGLGDARIEVADLRTTLRTLEADVGRAVEVGRRLEVDGEPVDVADVVNRLAGVEELRDRLTAANGELLDAVAFERRVAQLETSLVTEDELDQALRPLRDTVAGIDRAELLEAARRSALESVDSRVEGLDADLRAAITERFAEVEPAVAAAVDRATGALSERLLGVARQEIAQAVAQGDAGLREEFNADLDRRLSSLAGSIDDRLGQALEGVAERVTLELDARLPDLLGGLEGRLATVEGGHGDLGATVEQLVAEVQATAGRVEVRLREEAAARSRLATQLAGRMDAVEASVTPSVEAAVAAMREGLRIDLQAELAATRRDLEASLSAAARQAAATEVGLLATRLEGDVRVALRQELDGVRVELERAVDERAAASERRVAGLVAEEVRRATADIPVVVRREFDAFRPTIERVVDQRLAIRNPNRPTPVDRPPGGDVRRRPER